MAFLRIAVFDIQNAPNDAMEIWDDVMGSALRNHPDCLEVVSSRSGDELAVITTWVSEESFGAASQSKPIMDVHVTVSNRLGMSPDQDPSWSFEGPV